MITTIVIGLMSSIVGALSWYFAHLGDGRALAAQKREHDEGEPVFIDEPTVSIHELEREAFGIADTERFIRETDAVLNGLLWKETEAKMIPPSRSVVTASGVETVDVRDVTGRIIRRIPAQ